MIVVLPLVMLLPILLLTACDDSGPTKTAKKLALPKGENSLDQLFKNDAKLPAPPVAAHLSANPEQLDFPIQPLDSENSKSVQVRNDGGTNLLLTAPHLAGQAANFRWAGSCRAGTSLAPGDSCQIDITFRPLSPGGSAAELVIAPNLFLPLSGAGAAPAPKPLANASGDSYRALAFGRERQAAALTIQSVSAADRSRLTASPDYRDAGLPGIVSGFPVERARVLTADRVIPAVLENSLDSQLPGRAIAVVERPVFGADDRLVLIPAGSRIIGRYRAQSKYGLARLDISWSRILRPDGSTINLDAESADVMGRAGIPGQLDERWAEKYGAALLVSVIGAGSDWLLADNNTVVTSPLGGASTVENGRTQAANRFGNDMDKLGQRVVTDQLDIRPVLTVAQGTRLAIIPTEDLWLRDPEHLRPVTPPRGHSAKLASVDRLEALLPNLLELLLQSPSVQKTAPQTAQQILQSSLMGQLRDNETAKDDSSGSPAAQTPSGDGGKETP